MGLMISKACELKRKKRVRRPSPPVEQRRSFDLVEEELSEEGAASEASRCLGTLPCQSCDICVLLCPDLCITRNEVTAQVEIDYDYCKGCGICAALCPKKAIEMIQE
jgi:2-oxoacid:acceptor oxidoreductase delta subunit (pyruvate/2-ketoisovalerate family)